jgi:hypothetical protein
MDPHSFSKLDPDPHSLKKLDPDPEPDPNKVNAYPKHWQERRLVQDLILEHGMVTVHGRGGLKLEDMFEGANDREGARTRQATGSNNLKIPVARTEIRKNSYAVRSRRL